MFLVEKNNNIVIMEQYIVSARKYRPQTFESVIGQAALTATLKNAIANNHLAHAYLFCGPRGVGKTTCARIFAKTINCLNPTTSGEACNECESCKSFNEQRSFNIHELDAASNNLVDDIRKLVEQVRIPPQIGKYSVYIIDEVHMLTNNAFNAFLKTLEEPPAHAIFILATTEKHKIIATILSRCQIYDFNRITINDTVEHLKYVARDRGVEVEEMALNVIAQKADGAMRDALSIFDQVMSFCGNKITYDGVIANLNVLDYDYYFRLVDALLQNRVADALMVFDEVLSKGFEGQHFVGGLSSHLRDLMVSKDAITLPLLEVGAAIAERYKEQAQRCDILWLYKALEFANDCDLAYKASRNKRLLVEVMLIRIAGLLGGLQSKKVEPELPLIDVASTPGGQIKATEQQEVVNRPIVEERIVSQQSVSVVATGPIVVQKPITVKVDLATNVHHTQQEDAKPMGVEETPTEVIVQEAVVETDRIQLTLDALIKVWRLYAKKIEGELYTSKAMMNCLPSVIEGAKVVVKLVNQMQYDDLIKHRASIERFMSNELRSSGIDLEFVVDEKIAQEAILTQDEKYEHMLKINSDFRILKAELGLDLL